ncbi:CDP-diacylglycerol--serine O-phosphatidyltransferase [Thalassotalea sp. HSM 43]|uniref:CDP-diacylglycerol--serine O-phosphatidyltransferase n=1 Tax=Thalassotalea sp. HSM 43 TaxID=2552945 RepID=UPI0010813272|nr:CDP-diacylglycerol--serine O-phosphatidyltransferase [Thalassotalea sp. HSM 43]QBY04722.1 CDP-diacylglycerol--serine O-phosphatidyltransferase [Thalassotalea sp. HSM 43]
MIFSRNQGLSVQDTIPLASEQVEFLYSAREYHQRLLELIAAAKSRIYITALYLQDDEAGREVLTAIFDAKQANPQLDVNIFVDFHRAQRGLIGEAESLGNRQLYLDMSAQYEHKINIYGVPVKQREFLGVLHLKGFVIDDTLLFTGASINNIYLHQGDKYRCDRYHLFYNANLADSFVRFLNISFVNSDLAPKLNADKVPGKKAVKGIVKRLKALLRGSGYQVTSATTAATDLSVMPLLGLGPRANKLNTTARKVFRIAKRELVIFTPYFNFPKPLTADLRKALKKGVKVTIVVGDKTANDFYIADQEQFSTICIVPYIYETLLRNFIKRYQSFVDSGQLNIHLWKDGDNSYHLKGIVADDTYHLITGSNLNPRAWSLDLENGLLVSDQSQQLQSQWHRERDMIMANTKRVNSMEDIESINDYPDKPRELMRRIKLTQFDRVLKRFL